MGANNRKFDVKFLKKNGVDAEEVKQDYVGRFGGRYDIYDGATITIERKDGKEVIDTGLTRDEFFKLYGKEKDEKGDE